MNNTKVQTTPETTIIKKAASFPLHEIVEVEEGGYRIANHYLSHGYVLLGIVEWATFRTIVDKQGTERAVTFKDARYVVGRDANTLRVARLAVENSKQDA